MVQVIVNKKVIVNYKSTSKEHCTLRKKYIEGKKAFPGHNGHI
jgi:hypothetical protein